MERKEILCMANLCSHYICPPQHTHPRNKETPIGSKAPAESKDPRSPWVSGKPCAKLPWRLGQESVAFSPRAQDTTQPHGDFLDVVVRFVTGGQWQGVGQGGTLLSLTAAATHSTCPQDSGEPAGAKPH